MLPDTLFALVAEVQPGIYLSTDGARTWQLTDGNWAEFPQSFGWSDSGFYFDHDQGEVIYVGGGRVSDIIRSSDGGQTWGLCGDGDYSEMWLSTLNARLAVDPRDSDRLLAGGSTALVSEDGCQTWKPSNNGLGDYFVNAITYDLKNREIVYAGTNSGAYISFDSGAHWSPINDGLLGGTVIYSIVVDEESNVYAATPLGIFQLTNQ